MVVAISMDDYYRNCGNIRNQNAINFSLIVVFRGPGTWIHRGRNNYGYLRD